MVKEEGGMEERRDRGGMEKLCTYISSLLCAL